MTKMDQFVKAMELAFVLSHELGEDGINHIDWHITYHGTIKATQEIKQLIEKAMINAGCSVEREVA